MSGLLINGIVHPVEGVTIIGPHDAAWAHLSPGDGCPRGNHRPQQWFLHKTIADDPERLLPGSGPVGGARATATAWFDDAHSAGGHVITGHDGETACLCDLATWASYHARQSNFLSVGHEMKELHGGGFYEACVAAAVKVTIAGCRLLGIPLMAHWPYRNNTPLARMANGGIDCYGIFGHRDNTTERGRWDPGDIVYDYLRDAGVVLLDYAANKDREYVSVIQVELKRGGFYAGAIDGLSGQGTVAGLRAAGYVDGCHAAGKA